MPKQTSVITVNQNNIKRLWLSGTTCARHTKQQWISSCRNFVLMHHVGHCAYTDRVLKVQYCETYRDLIYMPDADDYKMMYGRSFLWQWKGRWTKTNQKFLEDIVLQHKELQL